MRTTLDLDQDVLLAAKEIAARSKRTAGKVISEIFRRGLHASDVSTAPSRRARANVAAGFEVMAAGKRVVTAQLVSKLRDETETR
jgi:predicted DNA-binding ribbon-helix-helix protein